MKYENAATCPPEPQTLSSSSLSPAASRVRPALQTPIAGKASLALSFASDSSRAAVMASCCSGVLYFQLLLVTREPLANPVRRRSGLA